jgi:predicted Zn-ribbon and HTH transcriptional regulator
MGSDIGSLLVMIAVISVVTIVIFLIGREIVCWYLKINISVELLTEIRDLLQTIKNQNIVKAQIINQKEETPPVIVNLQNVKKVMTKKENGETEISCGSCGFIISDAAATKCLGCKRTFVNL